MCTHFGFELTDLRFKLFTGLIDSGLKLVRAGICINIISRNVELDLSHLVFTFVIVVELQVYLCTYNIFKILGKTGNFLFSVFGQCVIVSKIVSLCRA